MNWFKAQVNQLFTKYQHYEGNIWSLLIGLILVASLCISYQWQKNTLETTLVNTAKLYTQSLRTFRNFYTSDIVIPSGEHGILITENYKQKEFALPLPATLTLELGEKISQQSSGVKASLYSLYPFPLRQDTGGLKDTFAQEAWSFLSLNPTQAYYKFAKLNGKPTLRYATADLMQPSCVGCHNSHPDSPKTNWRIGEVRGILEVALPVDKAQSSLHLSIMILAGLMGLVLLAAIWVLRRLGKK